MSNPVAVVETNASDANQEMEPEAATIHDDMFVDFEGSSVRWGDLTLQDRKAYMLGGYPY